MSKEIKKSLVPKLRFPEFRDAEEWEINILGKYVYLQNGFAFKSSKFVSDGIPIIRISNISSGSIILEDVVYYPSNEKIPSEFLVKDGDVLIAMSGATTGKVGMYQGNRSIFQNQRVGKFVPKSVTKVSKAYIFHLVNSNLFRIRLRAELEQGAQPNISSRQIENFEFPFSLYFEEQKTIADCLSSIDELITAQTQKIDALKAHKKGMMQKLFPAEDETLPKLRFPEFRDAGGWEETKLGKLAKRITLKNKEGKVTQVLSNSAAYGVVNQQDYFYKDIANAGNLGGYFVVEQGDYIYNARTSTIAPAGPISKNKIGTGIVSPLYTVFKFKDSGNDFYEQYFKSTYWHQYMRMISNSGARHSRMSFSNNDFMEMPLPDPCLKERQKIADCLSSVDELITAQTQKIDALKAHKKSIMQKLFPSHDEVNR